MLSDIFSDGMEGFLANLLNEGLKIFDTFLVKLVDIAFYAQDYMTSEIGMNFDNLFIVVNMFGIYLIILKFLKKGFDTYILWSDGDADMDPFIMCTGFFKAIIIAISFNTLYEFMVNIAMDMMNKILGSVNNVNFDSLLLSQMLNQFTSKGIVMIIVAIVYVFFYVILWIQFISRGLEIFILKVGVPLACVGLMDSDGGVFKPFFKKFFQEILTVMVQMFLLKISMVFMINGHFMFGIAAVSLALKTPQFLQEFIMVNSGGQGVASKVSQTVYTANMVRSFVR